MTTKSSSKQKAPSTPHSLPSETFPLICDSLKRKTFPMELWHKVNNSSDEQVGSWVDVVETAAEQISKQSHMTYQQALFILVETCLARKS